MRLTAEETLIYLKGLLEKYAEKLNGEEKNEFLYGEKTAYVECLEILQTWKEANRIGLDYEIEKKFPL